MCGETRRQSPGRHVAPDLLYFLLAVEIDEVDRELHVEGVDGLTGNDPKTFSGGKFASSQQASSARCAIVGNLHAISELGLPGEIHYFQPGLWLGVAAVEEAVH